MHKTVSTEDAQSHLLAYVRQASSRRDRFLPAQGGKPIAALVSVEDLERLEAFDALVPHSDETSAGEAAFQKALEEIGMVVSRPSGVAVPLSERVPLDIAGPSLSDQIIAGRR